MSLLRGAEGDVNKPVEQHVVFLGDGLLPLPHFVFACLHLDIPACVYFDDVFRQLLLFLLQLADFLQLLHVDLIVFVILALLNDVRFVHVSILLV